jgi:hypothetical protein
LKIKAKNSKTLMWFQVYVEEIFKTLINWKDDGTLTEMKFLYSTKTGKTYTTVHTVDCDEYAYIMKGSEQPLKIYTKIYTQKHSR